MRGSGTDFFLNVRGSVKDPDESGCFSWDPDPDPVFLDNQHTNLKKKEKGEFH